MVSPWSYPTCQVLVLYDTHLIIQMRHNNGAAVLVSARPLFLPAGIIRSPLGRAGWWRNKLPSASALLRGQEAAGTAACNSTSTPCLVNLRCGRFVLEAIGSTFRPLVTLSFLPSFLTSYLWWARDGRVVSQSTCYRCYSNSWVRRTPREVYRFKRDY